MKTQKLKLIIGCTAVLLAAFTSCSKTSDAKPGSNTGNTGTTQHTVNAKLVGTWLWTQGSDNAYYDNNGVYIGDAYGFATQYTINANGSGSCYSHIFSTLGVGSGIAVDISSTGFFETDDDGHMGYFPTKGTYTSSSSGARPLNTDELYNSTTRSGKSFLYQKVTFTTQGARQCFTTTTATNGTVDTYFKVK